MTVVFINNFILQFYQRYTSHWSDGSAVPYICYIFMMPIYDAHIKNGAIFCKNAVLFSDESVRSALSLLVAMTTLLLKTFIGQFCACWLVSMATDLLPWQQICFLGNPHGNEEDKQQSWQWRSPALSLQAVCCIWTIFRIYI